METGTLLILAGTITWIASAMVLRTRLPGLVVTFVLAATAMAVGAGSLLLVGTPTTAEWGVTLAVMGFMGPFQARMVLGAFGGNAGHPSGTVGPDRRSTTSG